MSKAYQLEPGTIISAPEFLDILEGDFEEVVLVKCTIEGDIHISESGIQPDEDGKHLIN